MQKHLLWVVCVAALAACGGGSSSVSAEDYPDALTEARCKNLVECQNEPDSATCDATVVLAGNDLETTLADIASGKILYDSGQAGKCLDEIKSQGCAFEGFDNGSDSACNHVFTGTVAQGGACFVDLECAGDAPCNATDTQCDTSTTCCPGTCGTSSPTTKSPLGGSCEDSSGCEGNVYCKFPDTGSGPGTCTALLTMAGAACQDLDACADPMYCDLDFSTFMGFCTTAAATGAACSNDELLPCADGRDYCDPTGMTCKRSAAVGAACSPDITCVGFAACVNAVCVAKPGLGGTCVDGQSPTCLGSLDCVSGSCTAPPAGTVCM